MTRIKDFIIQSVTPIDILRSRVLADKTKFNLGWCSVFPPNKNGVAATTYWFISKMLQKREIDIFAVPVGGRIDKSLFGGIKFARLGSNSLDTILFFSLGYNHNRFTDKIRVPYIAYQTLHDLNYYPQERKTIEQLKCANLVLTPTKCALHEYQKRGLERVKYLPHGVDTEIFRPNLQRGEVEVLFVGRLVYHKGIVPFLKSIPIVLKERPGVKFKIIGYLDSLYPTVKAKEHGNLAKFQGQLQEIEGLCERLKKHYPNNFNHDNSWVPYKSAPDIYKNSTILVLPSHDEGFGVPLIEAMSCGVPCIVADKPPMNEIIKDNETGYCIPFRDDIGKEYDMPFPHHEDIAEKIIYLTDNPEERKKMGKMGRKRAKEEYELDECVSKMIEYAKGVNR